MIGTYRAKLALRATRMSWLRNRAHRKVGQFPHVRTKKPHGLGVPLSITLTSYPLRFHHLAKTICSLIDQTVAADRIVLWVAYGDEKALPAEVVQLQAHGLSIRTCQDIRSYKKLIPSLDEFADNYLVTADDDVYYPPNWLDSLVSIAARNPRAVVGGRVHMAELNPDGSFKPYTRWELATSKRQTPTNRHLMFPTGVGGILYPPRAFHEEVSNREDFMRFCPQGDDIWFFWMAKRAGLQHLRGRDWFDVIEWPSTQQVALCNDNLHGSGNDEQIKAMEAHFGFIEEAR
ncbi:glycosyltransferase [Paracoccus sp. (in: a-proteobacteria)]|uniref:glycosyltransferase n=1 Tax=Paracoccus sp. TaxID=267 RepID=UPI00396C668E